MSNENGMPFINVKLIEGVFDDSLKREIVEKRRRPVGTDEVQSADLLGA